MNEATLNISLVIDGFIFKHSYLSIPSHLLFFPRLANRAPKLSSATTFRRWFYPVACVYCQLNFLATKHGISCTRTFHNSSSRRKMFPLLASLALKPVRSWHLRLVCSFLSPFVPGLYQIFRFQISFLNNFFIVGKPVQISMNSFSCHHSL